MIQAIRDRVTVKVGGVLELRHPELPAGTEAEVIIMVEWPEVVPRPIADFIGKAKGCFSSAAEVDAFLRAERGAWEP